jgi:hypothetical protein
MTCSRGVDSLALALASIRAYLEATNVPFYRDLVYMILTPWPADFSPPLDNTTILIPPPPLHVALSLSTGNESGLGPLLFSPLDLLVGRDDLALTFGTSQYYSGVKNDSDFETSNGWPSTGFILNEIDKRILIGLGQPQGVIPNFDPQRDASWLFTPAQLNASVPLDFTNTFQASFGSCTYPKEGIVMIPTGNETGEPYPSVGGGDIGLTWSHAYLSEAGMASEDNYTGKMESFLRLAYLELTVRFRLLASLGKPCRMRLFSSVHNLIVTFG